MKLPVILSALRSVLVFVGGIAVGKGWLPTEQLEPVVTAILALVAAGAAAWGVSSKSKDTATVAAANKVLEAAPAPVSKAEVAQAAATVQK